MNKLLSCVLAIAVGGALGGVGDRCYQNGEKGTIKRARQCESAPKALSYFRKLQLHGFEKDEPLICCVDREASPQSTTTTAKPVATTPRLGSSTTYTPQEYDYTYNAQPFEDDCAPLTATVAKTGQKAWDKCVEYQERLIYPCELSVAILGGLTRYYRCGHGQYGDQPALGYTNREQYPHMAQLGYRARNGTMVWRCSGALLSERFILTAASCQFGRKLGGVSYVQVGSRKGNDNVDAPQTHRVRNVTRHPKYRKPSLYHDIALVETDIEIALDQWTVPACLDVFSGDDANAVTTSWIFDSEKNVYAKPLQRLNRRQCLRRMRFRGRGDGRVNSKAVVNAIGKTDGRGANKADVNAIGKTGGRVYRSVDSRVDSNADFNAIGKTDCRVYGRVDGRVDSKADVNSIGWVDRNAVARARGWANGRAYRRLQRGYDDITQTCYGGDEPTAPDQINSRGSPLTITNKRVACMYDVLGVTSLKRVRRATTAIFTRVQYYVPWIESVVWP